MRCNHRHKNTQERGYVAPVSICENPSAHGWMCIVETCLKCGAVRKTNINQRHTETSGWIPVGRD